MNTTWDLVEDIEAIRRHLSIEKWMAFGGSWGSTLALTYAQQFPERVTELVIRGIFLLRRWEIDWFYQIPDGAAALFPDLWEKYVEPIPSSERVDMVGACHRRLTARQLSIRIRAARAWAMWEAATSHLTSNHLYMKKFEETKYALAFARIECHFFVNRGFFERDGQLLEDIDRVRGIPGVIIQGRYDVVCPFRSAWDLHRAWPEADLRIVGQAGHSGFEPGIARELVKATDHFVR